jgi:N utilization substance protein B
MTRSHAREIAVHMIFALSFGDFEAEELLAQQMNHERFEELAPDMPLYSQYPNEKQEKYIYALVRGVFGHGYELDDYIARYAKNWNFARIPRMAAAIMRTAMYEVLYMPEIPNAVAVNEAIEITKNYESPEVVSFVNGVLGTFVRTEFPDTPAKPEKADEAEG